MARFLVVRIYPLRWNISYLRFILLKDVFYVSCYCWCRQVLMQPRHYRVEKSLERIPSLPPQEEEHKWTWTYDEDVREYVKVLLLPTDEELFEENIREADLKAETKKRVLNPKTTMSSSLSTQQDGLNTALTPYHGSLSGASPLWERFDKDSIHHPMYKGGPGAPRHPQHTSTLGRPKKPLW